MFIIDNIYNDKFIKYKLTDGEISMIDEVWEFINIFNFKTTFVTEYRRNIIKIIREKYVLEKFYLLEMIANKIFWNLRWLLAGVWMGYREHNQYMKFLNNNYNDLTYIPDSLILCDRQKYETDDQLHQYINSYKTSTYYRSFINKLLMIDSSNHILYTKQIEGSSDIFFKNYFNLLTCTIFYDRELYEKIMRNPLAITEETIQLPEFYYQLDYGFSNLNLCTYEINFDKKERIKRMYYMDTPEESEANWFKIIYP